MSATKLTKSKETMLVNIILYLLQLIQQLYQRSLCQVLVASFPYFFVLPFVCYGFSVLHAHMLKDASGDGCWIRTAVPCDVTATDDNSTSMCVASRLSSLPAIRGGQSPCPPDESESISPCIIRSRTCGTESPRLPHAGWYSSVMSLRDISTWDAMLHRFPSRNDPPEYLPPQ